MYAIIIHTTFEEDSYKEGLIGTPFTDRSQAIVDSDTLDGAIKKVFSDLGYEYDEKFASIDVENGTIEYAVTVDNEYSELTEAELKRWKKGEIKAYCFSFSIEGYKLVKETFKPVRGRPIIGIDVGPVAIGGVKAKVSKDRYGRLVYETDKMH
jgi:hypothetical protein